MCSPSCLDVWRLLALCVWVDPAGLKKFTQVVTAVTLPTFKITNPVGWAGVGMTYLLPTDVDATPCSREVGSLSQTVYGKYLETLVRTWTPTIVSVGPVVGSADSFTSPHIPLASHVDTTRECNHRQTRYRRLVPASSRRYIRRSSLRRFNRPCEMVNFR